MTTGIYSLNIRILTRHTIHIAHTLFPTKIVLGTDKSPQNFTVPLLCPTLPTQRASRQSPLPDAVGLVHHKITDNGRRCRLPRRRRRPHAGPPSYFLSKPPSLHPPIDIYYYYYVEAGSLCRSLIMAQTITMSVPTIATTAQRTCSQRVANGQPTRSQCVANAQRTRSRKFGANYAWCARR